MRKFRNTLTTLAVAGLVATTPAIAHADVVDDYLAAVPSGQISCAQANNYWTNADDYQSKRSQALVAANFHPRGGEIRDALARIDEAAHRCGLIGGGAGAPAAAQQAPAPAVQAQAPAQQAPAPAVQAQAPAQQAPAQQAGQLAAAPAQAAPGNTVTVADRTFPVPEPLAPVVNWLRTALGNLGISF